MSEPLVGARSPTGRIALVGLGLLALLVVVAVAARGHLGGGGSGAGPSRTLLDYAFTLFFIAWVLMIPVTIWIYWKQRRDILEEANKRKKRSVLPGILMGGALVFLAYLVRHHSNAGGTGSKGLLRLLHRPGAHAAPPLHARHPYTPHFQVLPLALVLLALLAAAAYIVWRLTRPKPQTNEEALAENLSLVLDEALDDLLAERDPRRAVIKAYARMERVLAAHGLARIPHEAPFEYLERVLLDLHASGAATGRLTALFERAKFSQHDIDASMKDEAIDALTALREELRPQVAAA